MRINKENLEQQILDLFNNHIDEDTIIVGILRYGAHIPHLYYNACRERQQKPKNIKLLLSHMVTFFPPDYYENKKLILLDDTVYRGKGMADVRLNLINKCKVPKENIFTAALIRNEGFDSPPTDFPSPNIQLPNAEYIAWKELLGSLVSQNTRPTDRDHPLYYFEFEKIELGQFTDILQEYGWVHSSGTWNSTVTRIILTIDASVIKDVLKLPGVEIGSIYKFRFYWHEKDSKVQVTIVPMGFPVINLEKFISEGGGKILANHIGLDDHYFDNIYSLHFEDSRNPMLYYFASRSIAAFVLELFLNQLIPLIEGFGGKLKHIAPQLVDGPIEYVFPNEYKEFHEKIMSNIESILADHTRNFQNTESQTGWKKIHRHNTQAQKDPLIPRIYEILGFLAKDRNPVNWNGKEWIPDIDNDTPERGISASELIVEFKDPVFISRTLDELLESGLLRARDLPAHRGSSIFMRKFLPGGEYNALQVSRIADTLNYDVSSVAIDPNFAEEETIELWGRY